MRKAAFESVSRGCGFGFLGIACFMIGMSDPRSIFQAGGVLTLIMTLILLLKARLALTRDYKRTEMWLMLPKDFRPPEQYAQWAASTVLRDAYFTFAKYTAFTSIVMWVIALIFGITLGYWKPNPVPA
jgi:type IV secretory pathway VirB3-like protein